MNCSMAKKSHAVGAQVSDTEVPDIVIGSDGLPGEVDFEIDPQLAQSLEDEWQAILRGAKTYSQEEVDALIWSRYR
jgi:hypothetical protein